MEELDEKEVVFCLHLRSVGNGVWEFGTGWLDWMYIRLKTVSKTNGRDR